jgi:threonine dehydrogenase-like Zn-dependent dehydrogenase
VAAALRGAFDVLKPRGVIVQVGLGGDISLPINVIRQGIRSARGIPLPRRIRHCR